MKLIRLSLTIAVVSTSFHLFALNDPVAGIIFSQPVEENNISLYVNFNPAAEAYTEYKVLDTVHCLYIPSGKYAYFRVNDEIISENDHNLIIKITYFDEGFGTVAFQYNAIGSDNKYKRQSFKKTGSNTWATTTISLTDASFRNAQNNQADFRLNENNYIRSIEIYIGSLNPEDEEVPSTSGSEYSEFKGKSVAGYQAWFTASNTNSGWVHWSANTRPEPGNFSFEVYPDVREYEPQALFQTGFANLGNGDPSEVFTSVLVIDKHFEWMEENEIDGIALQRFIGDAPYPIISSSFSHLIKVKNAAENCRKIFYICYDMSSGKDENAWVQSIKFDWVYNIEQTNKLTSSPAYATVNNKPVVQIWGPGFTSRVGNAAGTIELINFLKSRGCYVIGGVPTHWRKEEGDSKPNFMSAYRTYDMVSPWTPGRYKGITEVDNFMTNQIIPDKSFCDANGLDYMPVLFPGFAWSTWNNGIPNHIPRQAGEFLWRQAYNIKLSGLNQMYFAMFDEYDEGTAIMKAATDWSMIPTNQYFLTLSTDGIWVSSDFYLRVAGAATAMVKSAGSPSELMTVPYSEGPVFYRNSFEKRYTQWERNGIHGSGYFNLDPCFYNPVQISNINVLSPVCEIENNPANSKSGEYAVKVSGIPNSDSNASYDYKIAEVKIPVVNNMKLSFRKKTINELGKYVSLDLQFKSGKRLSQLASYTDNNGNSMHPSTGRGTVGEPYEEFVCEIGKDELSGDEITGIIIAYNKPSISDSYLAYIDDILFTTDDISVSAGFSKLQKKENRIFVINNSLNFTNTPLHSEVTILNISGVTVAAFLLERNVVNVQLPNGVYVVKTRANNVIYSQKIVITQ